MRIMTYNIWDGAVDRLRLVAKVVNDANPDVLVINEANGFDADGQMERFAEMVQMPHYHLEKCGDGWVYHVAMLSKYPFKSTKALMPVSRGIVVSEIDYLGKKYTIAGLHLSPFSEDDRVNELDLLRSITGRAHDLVVMGDFNSLSVHEKLTDDQVKSAPDSFRKKFMHKNSPRYDADNLLTDMGLVDVAAKLHNFGSTIPTHIGHVDHLPVRLDRAYTSEDMVNRIEGYKVVKNEKTNIASDHYPIILDINA